MTVTRKFKLVNPTKSEFGCTRLPCINCGGDVTSSNHIIRYVAKDSVLIKCNKVVPKIRKVTI